MRHHPTHLFRIIVSCLFAFLLSPVAVAAAPTLEAPATAVVKEPFMVTVDQAPQDLRWDYDTGRLRLIKESPGRAVFEPVAPGPARFSASSAQTGWSSGDQTVQISPATTKRPPGKSGAPPGTGADPGDDGKSQKVGQLLDKYKASLLAAGLEGKFGRKDADTEKLKVKLKDAESKALARISGDFLAEMTQMGLTMHDFMDFKRIQGQIHAAPGEPALFPGKAFWDANYLGTERALMMGRAEMVDQVWTDTLSEVYRRHPDWIGVDRGKKPVIYGRMDIGSWVKMDLAGLAFKADIDFSSLATSLWENQVVKGIFNEMLGRHLTVKGKNLAGILDAVLTPHGAAGEEVFIGEWGKAFAEMDMLKRSSWTLLIPEVDAEGQPVFDNRGRIKLKTKEMSGQSLFWEHAFRTGKKYNPPKITIETEPMMSLEMLRHMTADIINKDIFGPGDKIIKMLKYVERSYLYNKKATAGTGWDPYAQNDAALGDLAREMFKERKEGGKKTTWAKNPEK